MTAQKATIGIAAATAAIMITVVAALLSSSTLVHTTGAVKTIGVSVYWDASCTNATSSIDWSTLAPNTSRSIFLYIKNNGTAPLRLSMSTSAWSPSNASSYLPLSWNCTNAIVNVNAVTCANLTLSVSPNIAGISSFSFDLIIAGTE